MYRVRCHLLGFDHLLNTLTYVGSSARTLGSQSDLHFLIGIIMTALLQGSILLLMSVVVVYSVLLPYTAMKVAYVAPG